MRAARETGKSLGGLKLKEKQLALICSQFSIILTSGLSVDKCVEMVAAQTKDKELRAMLQKVARDVAGGYGMAQSFENNCRSLPATFTETIRAGEQSGTLETCFDRLHTYYDKSAKTKAKVVSTLTYPAIVLFVAAVVFIVIMTVAVPMFISTFEELDVELPGITKALIAASNFITGYWWAVFLIIGVFFAARALIARTEKGRISLARGKLKRSPLHRLHGMNAAAQFANTMATMLAAGLPVVKALEVTANVASNYLFAASVRRVRQSVEQGHGLAGSMAKSEYFPSMLTEMTGVGERSGNLEQTLTVIGSYFDNEVSVMTERLLAMLEPAITIGLAVITVILLLAVYLPMFSMYGSI